MVLEAFVVLCVIEPDFWRKKNCPKYGEIGLKWAGNRIFWIIRKFSHLFSLNLVYNESLLLAIFLHKFHIWEKSSAWDMGQNAVGQSDCRIFKSTISLEQKLGVSQEVINGINWFLVCWYKFRKAKSFFNNLGVVVIKNGLLGLGTLLLYFKNELMKWGGFFANYCNNNGWTWSKICDRPCGS